MIAYFFSTLLAAAAVVAVPIGLVLLGCLLIKWLDRRDFLLEPFDCYPEPDDAPFGAGFDHGCRCDGCDTGREIAGLELTYRLPAQERAK